VSYQVTLKASGKQFNVNPDENLLEAALRQGINLPYGCKNGACGSCKGKILEGQVTHGQHSENAMSQADKTAGALLFCCAQPQSDLLIEAREVQLCPTTKRPINRGTRSTRRRRYYHSKGALQGQCHHQT